MRGDQLVEAWSHFLQRRSIELAVFPEVSRVAISDLHERGRPEERLNLRRSLDWQLTPSPVRVSLLQP